MDLFDELWKQYLSTPNRRAFGEFDGWLVDQIRQIRTDRDCLYIANSEFIEDINRLKAEIARLSSLNSELLRNCSDLVDVLDNLDQSGSYLGVRKWARATLASTVNHDRVGTGSDEIQ